MAHERSFGDSFAAVCEVFPRRRAGARAQEKPEPPCCTEIARFGASPTGTGPTSLTRITPPGMLFFSVSCNSGGSLR